MANPTSQTSCFAPDPIYTFLFAPSCSSEPPTCVICTESTLTLPRSREATTKDTNPSLLPCGHVFGTKCLALWLETHDTCPTCRFRLKYELCKHPIAPRRLTRENVFFVPQTIPDGGAVGDQCGRCRTETDQRVAAELCMVLAKGYYELRGVYEKSRDEGARRAMVKQKASLDRAVEALKPAEDRVW